MRVRAMRSGVLVVITKRDMQAICASMPAEAGAEHVTKCMENLNKRIQWHRSGTSALITAYSLGLLRAYTLGFGGSSFGPRIVCHQSGIHCLVLDLRLRAYGFILRIWHFFFGV